MPRLCLWFAVIFLAACSSPSPRPQVESFTGMNPSQRASLLALGVPIVVPELGSEWRVTRVETEAMAPGASFYVIRWQRGGECLEVSGATDGLGGPQYPDTSMPVRLAQIPGQPTILLYQADADPLAESAEIWGPSTVISDYIEIPTGDDGILAALFASREEDGCGPLSLEATARIVATLHLLSD